MASGHDRDIGVRKHFNTVVDLVKHDWKELGYHLGLKYSKIAAIEENRRGDPTEGCRDVLEKWVGIKGRAATLSALQQALIDTKHRDVAEKLDECQKKDSHSPPPPPHHLPSDKQQPPLLPIIVELIAQVKPNVRTSEDLYEYSKAKKIFTSMKSTERVKLTNEDIELIHQVKDTVTTAKDLLCTAKAVECLQEIGVEFCNAMDGSVIFNVRCYDLSSLGKLWFEHRNGKLNITLRESLLTEISQLLGDDIETTIETTIHPDHFKRALMYLLRGRHTTAPAEYPVFVASRQPMLMASTSLDALHLSTNKLHSNKRAMEQLGPTWQGARKLAREKQDLQSTCTFLLVGCKGNGKSHTGNTILGQEAFRVTRKGGTQEARHICSHHQVDGATKEVTVVDTPGVSQEMTESEFEELVRAVKMVPEGFDAICLVWDYYNSEKNEDKEVQVFQSLHRLFGDRLYDHLIILVTHAQQEDIPEFIDGLSKAMKNFIPADKADYVIAIENKPYSDSSPGSKEQVNKLLSVLGNMSEKYKESDLSLTCQIIPGPQLHIAIVGKTGVGKSHTGNTITGDDVFVVADIASSITKKCTFGRRVKDREILVLDTPGVFSTDDHNLLEMTQELCRIVTLFGDEGLHALVVVISSRVRFTESETKAINIFQHLFGSKFVNYAIILVTGKDNLRGMSESEFLSAPESLRTILERCGNRYIFFDNTTRDETLKRQQLVKLIQMIDERVKENGGSYTDDLFQEGKRYMEQILEETKRQHPTWSLIEQRLEAKRKALEKDYSPSALFKRILHVYNWFTA